MQSGLKAEEKLMAEKDGGAREIKEALTDPESGGIVFRDEGDLADSEDIILEILARLPVKTLMRFRCVCKPWRALIADPYFVKKHFDYAERGISDNPSRLIISMRPPLTLDYQALNNLDLEEKEDVNVQFGITALDLPARFPDYSCGKIAILGSSNGLVCVFVEGMSANDNYDIVLWNPSTRESKVLPKPPETFTRLLKVFGFYGFGYDSTTDDYKIVIGCYSYYYMFALKTSSWTTICGFNRNVHDGGCFLNGALHWCVKDESRVVSFHLEEEKFEDIVQLPCHTEFSGILVFRNCLCVVELLNHFNRPDLISWVWMMKEYGVAESWTRVLKFSFDYKPGKFLIPLWILENGEILMNRPHVLSNSYGHTIELVNQTTSKTVCEVDIELGWFRADIYRDSLISPVI